ncbi:MAG TPA: hypothetical protein VME45_05135 [Stellaceae bacterium]|nr:hypothetical protein [Stellaceae bacterium]
MRLALMCFAVLAVAGRLSSAVAEPKAPVDPSLVASDTALLQDEAKATAELQRRLRSQVSYRNGVLVIIEHGEGVTVMPATVMWGVDCGQDGLAVTFGTGSGDSDNGTVLQLTSAEVTDDKCTRIAPAVGETVLAITKGN